MLNIPIALKQEIIDGKRAVLMKIERDDGTIFAYTDHDMPLMVDGQLYTPAPGLQRINLTSTSDDRVSNQEFAAGWVDAPEEDLLSGKFDNAEVTTMICSWDRPDLGSIVIDKGNLGIIQWTADGFRGDVQSHMRQLQRNISFTYTASCRHKLFSTFGDYNIGACTLNEGSYSFSGAVASINTDRISFNVSGLNQADGFCSAGMLTWTSGANIGLQTMVKKHTVSGSVTIELFLPAQNVVAIGDNFNITAGCDKTHATCKNKFNNVINFGGFPHIQVEVSMR